MRSSPVAFKWYICRHLTEGERGIFFSINIYTACFAGLGYALCLGSAKPRRNWCWCVWPSFAVPSYAISQCLPPSCPTPGCSPHQGDGQQCALNQGDVSAWDFESEETTPPGCSEEKGGWHAPAAGRCPRPSSRFPRRQVCLEQQNTSAACCVPTRWPKTCEAVLLSLFLLLICKCPEFISSVLMEISFFPPT